MTLLQWKALGYTLIFIGLVILGIHALAQGPTISQSYGITLERDDFPVQVAGTNVPFKTSVGPRSGFVMVYRNGLLTRPCPTGVTANCDYTVSGSVTVTFPSIADGDLITLLFQR